MDQVITGSKKIYFKSKFCVILVISSVSSNVISEIMHGVLVIIAK